MNPVPRYSFDDIMAGVAMAIPFLIITGILIKIMYSRLQAHLLEFMFILTFCTMPGGLMIRHFPIHVMTVPSRPAAWTLLMLMPLPLILAASMWGLSCAKRLKEERTWHRLGLIVLGWLLVSSVPGALIGLWLLGSPNWDWLGIVLICAGPMLFGVCHIVESRCKEQSPE